VHGEEPDVPALDEVLEEYVEGRSVEGAEMEIFWVGKSKERKRRVSRKGSRPESPFRDVRETGMNE
jgi:hypothetical protein